MLKLVCLTLIKIEIEWQYDSREMKLKCRTKVDDEKLVDDDQFIEDFIRQQFLKFYVYVDKVVKNSNLPAGQQKRSRGPPASKSADSSGRTQSSSGSRGTMAGDAYVLNLYLQKGTTPVFLEMADKFFSIIQSQLTNQDKVDDSSPNTSGVRLPNDADLLNTESYGGMADQAMASTNFGTTNREESERGEVRDAQMMDATADPLKATKGRPERTASAVTTPLDTKEKFNISLLP